MEKDKIKHEHDKKKNESLYIHKPFIVLHHISKGIN